jgi:hypothetical protein
VANVSADDDLLTDETRATGTRDRSPLTWTIGAVVVAVIAGAVVFGLLTRGDDEPGTPPGGNADVGSASVTELVASPASERCMVPNVEVLRRQTLAFDGVVRSVTGGEATLTPSQFYAGEVTDRVVVAAPDHDLQALLAAVEFREGQRYLVAATEGEVVLCGFSGPYSEQLAALYAEAFAK